MHYTCKKDEWKKEGRNNWNFKWSNGTLALSPVCGPVPAFVSQCPAQFHETAPIMIGSIGVLCRASY